MRSKIVILLCSIAALLFVGCSERMDPIGSTNPSPLEVTATANPDSIPVGYGAGLYADINGAELPLRTAEWLYQDKYLSSAQAITFVPDSVREYEFAYHVTDAAGRDTTVFVRLWGLPLDSIFFPPDTVVTPPDTVQLPPDTVEIIRIDTLMFIDTLIQIDTVDVHHYDTTVTIDTLYQYITKPVYSTCQWWEVKEGTMSYTINLGNPEAGTFTVHAFRKRLTENLPSGMELKWDFGNGQIEYTSVYGDRKHVEAFSDIVLPANASITISLETPQFLGKVAGILCWRYFEGNWWWLTQPTSD